MTTVRTVADSRVVAEQGVVLNQYVGPLNWEHYKIPASGLSNSQITFANLVTLGTNRIYDSNFQIEYTIEISLPSGTDYYQSFVETMLRPHPFPLHWVTDQLRTNINGAACMVRPQEQLFQRMSLTKLVTIVLIQNAQFLKIASYVSFLAHRVIIQMFLNKY